MFSAHLSSISFQLTTVISVVVDAPSNTCKHFNIAVSLFLATWRRPNNLVVILLTSENIINDNLFTTATTFYLPQQQHLIYLLQYDSIYSNESKIVNSSREESDKCLK